MLHRAKLRKSRLERPFGSEAGIGQDVLAELGAKALGCLG